MQEFKEGDTVKCVVGEGWGHFEEGDLLTVTGSWYGGIYLDHHPVANQFFSDFELVEANHG